MATLSHGRSRAGLGLSSVIPVAEGEFYSALPVEKVVSIEHGFPLAHLHPYSCAKSLSQFLLPSSYEHTPSIHPHSLSAHFVVFNLLLCPAGGEEVQRGGGGGMGGEGR